MNICFQAVMLVFSINHFKLYICSRAVDQCHDHALRATALRRAAIMGRDRSDRKTAVKWDQTGDAPGME